MPELIITNGYFCTIQNDSVEPLFGDAVIVDGRIDKIIPKEFSPEKISGQTAQESDNVYNAGGRAVTIPLVNFHDHIYSRLAKGLPVLGAFDNFENILKNLWWKLDTFLDDDMNRASAQLAALDSISQGVQIVIDHHSSQSHPANSLSILADELKSAGLRSVMCFETTDRNGSSADGIKENVRFLKNCKNSDMSGLFGLHASFTLNDDSLAAISGHLKELEAGIHIHLYEDAADRKRSMELFRQTPVERLLRHNLINDKSILAHGLFIDDAEFNRLGELNPFLVFNVDSNMNNGVGIPPFKSAMQNLHLLAGTDGMHANMNKSLKQIFLAARLGGLSFDESFGLIIKIYFDQIRFVNQHFPGYGKMSAGADADFAVYDYVPPTPLTKENFWGHYIYGMLESPVRSSLRKGKFLLKDFVLKSCDESQLRRNIYRQGDRLMNLFIDEAKKNI